MVSGSVQQYSIIQLELPGSLATVELREGDPKGGALGTTHVAVSKMRPAYVMAVARNLPG